MKQIVKITTDIGIITLSCESKYSYNNIIQIDNIYLTNVPITYNPSQTIPIIYNKTNEFANICLLEELTYDISFESDENELEVFKTLKNFKDNSPVCVLNITLQNIRFKHIELKWDCVVSYQIYLF